MSKSSSFLRPLEKGLSLQTNEQCVIYFFLYFAVESTMHGFVIALKLCFLNKYIQLSFKASKTAVLITAVATIGIAIMKTGSLIFRVDAVLLECAQNICQCSI